MPKGKPGSYLVGGIPTPLKNMSSSVGVTYDGKNKIHVPNHQPVFCSVVTVEGTTWVAALMKPAWEMEL